VIAPNVASPVVAETQVDADKAVADNTLFMSKPDGGSQVQVSSLELPDNKKAFVFTSGMRIDVDGAGVLKNSDPVAKPDTALHGADGKPLDPSRDPYVVISKDFLKLHPEVHLGDYVAMTYGGKTTFGYIGDVGPEHALGEASPLPAASVGINPSPTSGGTDWNVRYIALAGSADKHPPPSAAATKQRALPLFAQYHLISATQ